jgi:hypothetical protein
MKYVSMILVLLSLMFGIAWASELREIELNDGSSITAEVRSLQDGIYTLKSSSLGTLRIQASEIRTIRSPGANTQQAQPIMQPISPLQPSVDAQIQGLQQQMLGNPSIMSMIQALQQNSVMQDILSDPGIQQALNSGDIGALLAHPKLQRLLHDETMQQIMREMHP